jgi:hypothetical protein
MSTLFTILTYLATIVVFYFTASYINRAVAEKGIPSGMVRGLLVVFLASVVALFAGAAVDWVGDTVQAETKDSK